MEMLIRNGQVAKPRRVSGDISREWWQVSYAASGLSRIKSYRRSDRAASKADTLYAKGIHCKIEPCRTDVYIADQVTGDFLLIATRLDPMEASRFIHAMAKDERESGCMLWPHGSPLPECMAARVVDKTMASVTKSKTGIRPNHLELLNASAKSIDQSRLSVEKLIDQTPNDEHALSLLGPILAELRTALATVEELALSSDYTLRNA